MTDRAYSYNVVSPGIYVALPNDGHGLYLVVAYDEDGSATRTDARGRERVVKGRYWAVARVPSSLFALGPDGRVSGFDLAAVERWYREDWGVTDDFIANTIQTRTAALGYVAALATDDAETDRA